MVRQQGPEPELWIGEACKLAGLEKRAGQEYVNRGVFIPKEGAVGRGGRHTFGKIEVVQLAVTSVLADAGVPLRLIGDFFSRLRTKGLYLSKLVDWERSSRKRQGEIQETIVGHEYAESVGFDPFPHDEPVLDALRDEYVQLLPPEKLDLWPLFWTQVRQLASPSGVHKGNESYQVLLPKKLMNNKIDIAGRRSAKLWRQAAMHGFAWDFLEIEGMGEVTDSICLIDLASIKARVGTKLLKRGWMGPYVKGMGVVG